MLKNYKLNKSELTRLKQEIKIYQHFLPVLKLKQEQLQIEQLKVKKQYQYISEQYSITKAKISPQFALFTDTANPYSISDILTPQKNYFGRKKCSRYNYSYYQTCLVSNFIY